MCVLILLQNSYVTARIQSYQYMLFYKSLTFFKDTVQVLQKNSRYDGQIPRLFEKVEVQTTTDFSSKHQEKSSCVMFQYEHYTTDLQLSNIPRHKLFQITTQFTKAGVFKI